MALAIGDELGGGTVVHMTKLAGCMRVEIEILDAEHDEPVEAEILDEAPAVVAEDEVRALDTRVFIQPAE